MRRFAGVIMPWLMMAAMLAMQGCGISQDAVGQSGDSGYSADAGEGSETSTVDAGLGSETAAVDAGLGSSAGTDSGAGTGSGVGQTGAVSGELTIASFMDVGFLEGTARKYELARPGTKITVNTYHGDTRDAAQYAQTVNTALMSGNAEDIIDMGGISWTKLAEKGKLADLNDIVDFPSDDYYTNVLDAYLYDGKLYTVPLSFTFEAYSLTEAYRDAETPDGMLLRDALTGRFGSEAYEEPAGRFTLDVVLDLAERYPGVKLFDEGGNGRDETSFAYNLFCLDFDKFVDVPGRKADIDNELFVSLLNDVASLEGRLVAEETGEETIFSSVMVYSPVMCNAGTLDYGEMFPMTNREGEGVFSTIGFMPAVNADAKNPELAADFMRFLLSEENLATPELMFAPIHRTSNALMADLMLESIRADGYEPEGFNFKKNVVTFNSMAGKLAINEHEDRALRNFVYDEMQRFFDGGQSAAQAAENLHSRLNTYFQE